jgi:hypothetical protein
MVTLVTNKQHESDLNDLFARDIEFGWGRGSGAAGTISFFDSPAIAEVVLPPSRRATASSSQRAMAQQLQALSQFSSRECRESHRGCLLSNPTELSDRRIASAHRLGQGFSCLIS